MSRSSSSTLTVRSMQYGTKICCGNWRRWRPQLTFGAESMCFCYTVRHAARKLIFAITLYCLHHRQSHYHSNLHTWKHIRWWHEHLEHLQESIDLFDGGSKFSRLRWNLFTSETIRDDSKRHTSQSTSMDKQLLSQTKRSISESHSIEHWTSKLIWKNWRRRRPLESDLYDT